MVILSDFRHEVTNKNLCIKKDFRASLAHLLNLICPCQKVSRNYFCISNLGEIAPNRTKRNEPIE